MQTRFISKYNLVKSGVLQEAPYSKIDADKQIIQGKDEMEKTITLVILVSKN